METLSVLVPKQGELKYRKCRKPMGRGWDFCI